VAVVDPDVVDDAAVFAAVTLAETRRHAEALPAAVDDVLARADVDVGALAGIGVGTGPGSFIGVRTGLAYAKGLGRAVDRPVVGVPSLTAWALSPTEPVPLPRGRGLVVADARRGERYVATVTHADHGIVVHDDEHAVADATFDVLDSAGGCAFVLGGTAGLAIPGDVVVVERSGPSALGLVRALRRVDRTDARAALVPRYVRPPDAKLPAVDPARHRPPDPAEGPP